MFDRRQRRITWRANRRYNLSIAALFIIDFVLLVTAAVLVVDFLTYHQ